MTQEGTGDRIAVPNYTEEGTGTTNLIRFPVRDRSPRANDSTTAALGLQYGLSVDFKKGNVLSGRQGYNFIPVRTANRELIDTAFDRILGATDVSLSISERSNSFDEWKESLVLMARKIEHFDGNHRKILGAVISANKGKDICDFIIDGLKLFLQATNILRQPRVTKPEVRQILKSLLDKKLAVPIPLVPDGANEVELDNMMAGLLAMDQKLNGR